MEKREWYNVSDKSSWGEGEWNSEPDKAQWQDEATGLPCLIVRNPSGALCGYVGVPKSHSAYGLNYYDYDNPNAIQEQINNISVHGGLTFANHCDESSELIWHKMQSYVERCSKEAKRYPNGDSAHWLKQWEPVLHDYDKFKEKWEASSICHIADDDKVWWFGFDCGHCNDLAPAHKYTHGGNYRNLVYVKEQCKELAQQLKAIG